jgi:hypothetical protein
LARQSARLPLRRLPSRQLFCFNSCQLEPGSLPGGPVGEASGRSARPRSIRGDANVPHICAAFASPRTTRTLCPWYRGDLPVGCGWQEWGVVETRRRHLHLCTVAHWLALLFLSSMTTTYFRLEYLRCLRDARCRSNPRRIATPLVLGNAKAQSKAGRDIR